MFFITTKQFILLGGIVYYTFLDDHSRVILHVANKHADYINANYIDVSVCSFYCRNSMKTTALFKICISSFFQGIERKHVFIAAQGKLL